MIVQDLINLAKAGELQQVAVKDDTATVVSFINLGLTELYKRFQLKTNEHIITLQTGVTIYDMPTDFLNLIAAYDEVPVPSLGFDTGVTMAPIPINEENNPLSINTVSYNQIQVPVISNGAYISIIYAAKPNVVTVDNLSAELDIPDGLIEPLLHYVGYRGHGAINGNIQTEANTHYMRFEASCKKARELGVAIASDDLEMPEKFKNRGFA